MRYCGGSARTKEEIKNNITIFGGSFDNSI